jgi:hypothetical protein
MRGQARWQVDGTKPMTWRFIIIMLTGYVLHRNIPGAWDIIFTALGNIEVAKVSQKKNHF